MKNINERNNFVFEFRPVTELFEEQVKLHPEKCAVVSGKESFTYAQLNERANRIANALVEKGVRRETIVGVVLERCCDFYAVRQGILKAGGAFAVATPDYPDDRIRYIFEDSGAPFIITTKEIAEERRELFAKLPCTVLLIEELLENENTENPQVKIGEHDLCYCIYTSGSTGKPKGVLIEHINLANFVNPDSKNAEKERRAMLKQNIAMDQLIQGVTRIVERFAVCDLDSGIYEYYEMNNESYYNPTGDYRELLQRMSGEYVVLTEKINIQMDDLLSPEHLRKVIMSEDDLYTFEYCTLDRSSYKVMSVIPVEWKGSILSKVMLIAQDIGQKHELEKLANTDALTGLYNERYLSERLKRNGKLHKKFAMFYLDLDRFKPVNDTYGHDMGDRLLKAVSRRLCKCIRKTDYAFRIGGDEFSLIIEEGNINDEFCEMMVRRIKNAIDRPFDIEGRLLSVDTSCGYAIYPEHSQKIDEIRIMADHRMYEDKTQNRKKGQ